MEYVQLGVLSIWLVVCLCYIPYSIRYRNYNSLKFITVALMLQNFMSLFASNVFSGSAVSQFVILYKEIIFWGTVLFTCLGKWKIKKGMVPALMFIVYMALQLFAGEAAVYSRLVCFRQIMTPVILVLYGRTLKLSRKEKQSYMSFLVSLGIFQAVFGLVERFVLGDAFWLSLNIGRLFETKGFARWVFGGLPGNYYSADLYHFIGKSIRRLVGVTTDPLLTGHYLALCIILLLFVNLKRSPVRRYMELILMTVACFLTFSKGAILIIGVSYIYKIWVRNKVAAFGLLGIAGTVVAVIIKNNLLKTVAIHVAGFTTVFSDLSLFGGGLGTVGNLASLSGSDSASGESLFGMILGQTGGIGLFLFLFMIYRMGRWVLKIEKSMYEYAVIAYITAVMIEAVVSESAVNFVGSGCAFIMLGAFTTASIPDETENCSDSGVLAL